ncbi:MAG: glycosyltransferase [Acidimicrobiales bacterium]
MEGTAAVERGLTRARVRPQRGLERRRPRVSRVRTLIDLLFLFGLVAAGVYLLAWRAGMLDRVGPAGWALFGLEVLSVGWLVTTALLFTGRASPRQVAPEADPATTLDVFIPVAGEPVAMVAATIAAAKAIRWPVNIVVCNDGYVAERDNWQEIENLCRREGVYCVTRLDGPRGKAANLNSALAWSRADAVLTIDADHQVVPHVAQELLGYLRHEEIAFVTTPQEFHGSRGDALSPTEPVFYRATQPARDRHGLAFSTGNGVLYRREALVRIGGFSEWSLVEDLHTSIRLHAAGWRSAFHPRPVTVGLAPGTAAEYARQRLRWALDSLRILRFDPPWRRKGLSWRARIHYTHTLVSYLSVMLQLAFVLGPPAYIVGRLSLLDDSSWQSQALHLGPWMAMVVLTVGRWAGLRGALRSIRLTIAFLPVVFWAAAWRLVRSPDAEQGSVTAKTNQSRLNRMVVAALAVPLGLIGTMVWGVFDRRAGGSDLAMVWATVLAVAAVGPVLRFGSRFWPFVARSVVVLTAVALTAGAVATTRFGWAPPLGLYQSFRVDTTLADAVVEVNELGDTYLAGPPVAAESPPAPAEAEATTPVRVGLEPSDSGIYLGFTSDALPYDLGDVDRWAAEVSSPQIVHWYQQWGSGDSRFRGDWAREVADSGRVPMISWEAWAKPEGGYKLAEQELGNMADIADGRYDAYLDEWAAAAADYGQPILLRPFHEMNGNWYPWSVGVNGNTNESYIAGWRHLVDRFRAAGATNVRFVWSINTLANFDQGRGVAAAYPGDDYVDWVATSGFNWDDYASWASWVTPQWVFADTYRLLQTFDKPIMFAEVGTGKNGGDAAAWVADAMRWFATLGDLKAVVWFDRSYDGSIDFRLGPGQQRAVADAVAAPASPWSPPPSLREHPEIDPALGENLSAVGLAPPADRIDAASRAGEPVVAGAKD